MGSVNAFANTGPTHLMAKTGAGSPPSTAIIEIDWDNVEHRRCITACLVKGTYVLESERAKLSDADGDDDDDSTCKPLAPAWWESFHFRRLRVLKCECGCVLCKIGRHIVAGRRSPRFIYGAIFEYAPPADASRRHPSAPSYIVAFRGTMRRDATTLGDMRLDLRILLNAHHSCGRFSHAREEVGKFLDSIAGATSSCAVWLAGHSLGASIALDVGRAFRANRELNVPTFLFNPPQVSPAAVISVISDKVPMAEVAKRGLHTSSCILSTDWGKFSSPTSRTWMNSSSSSRHGCRICTCTQRDIICKGFIDYFEQRERIQKWLPRVAASGTTLSYRDMCRSLFDGQNDRPHLLPSAILWKNQSSKGDARELRQWWQPEGPELVLSQKSYKWSASTKMA